MNPAGVPKPSRIQLIILFSLHIVASACLVSQPIPIREVINGLGRGESIRYFLPLVSYISLLGISGAILLFVAYRYGASLGYQVIRASQNAMFKKLINMPLLFFTTAQPGAIASRITNDVAGMEALYSQVTPALISSGVTLVMSAAVLFAIEPLLLLILFIVPLCLVPIRLAERQVNHDIREAFEITRGLSSIAGGVLTVEGVTLARTSGRSAHETSAFEASTSRLAQVSSRTATWRASVGLAYGITFTLLTSAIVLLCVWLADSGVVTTGDLVLALVYSLQIREPITALIGARYPRIRARIAHDRVQSVMAWRPTSPRPAVSTHSSSFHEAKPVALEICDLSYRYPSPTSYEIDGLSHVGNAVHLGWLPLAFHDQRSPNATGDAGRLVLRNVNLRVERGRMVAVVGASGAGKSTLAMIAAGLLEPSSGAVRLDNRETVTYSEGERASKVAYISQATHVLHASVRENLLYATPHAEEKDLLQACDAAQFANVLRNLPDGLDTVLGEKGHRLSGGERQRLALARALLQRPSVVILDEPTAHLDAATEASLKEILTDAFRSFAVLMIAHRLSTVIDADEIVVLDQGRVTEKGTHEELLSRQGLYSMLINAQARSTSN